ARSRGCNSDVQRFWMHRNGHPMYQKWCIAVPHATEPLSRSAHWTMATHSAIRLRRSAAQRHALATIERQIRAADPNSRRKYLRDFNEAFRQYEKLLTTDELDALLRAADLVLVGDYHALPVSQLCAAALVEKV